MKLRVPTLKVKLSDKERLEFHYACLSHQVRYDLTSFRLNIFGTLWVMRLQKLLRSNKSLWFWDVASLRKISAEFPNAYERWQRMNDSIKW